MLWQAGQTSLWKGMTTPDLSRDTSSSYTPDTSGSDPDPDGSRIFRWSRSGLIRIFSPIRIRTLKIRIQIRPLTNHFFEPMRSKWCFLLGFGGTWPKRTVFRVLNMKKTNFLLVCTYSFRTFFRIRIFGGSGSWLRKKKSIRILKKTWIRNTTAQTYTKKRREVGILWMGS